MWPKNLDPMRFAFAIGLHEIFFGLSLFFHPETALFRLDQTQGTMLSAAFLIGGVTILLLIRYDLPSAFRRLLAVLPALPQLWLVSQFWGWDGFAAIFIQATFAFITMALFWLPVAREGSDSERADLLDLVEGVMCLLIGIGMLWMPGVFAIGGMPISANAVRLGGVAALLGAAANLLPGRSGSLWARRHPLRRLIAAANPAIYAVLLIQYNYWSWAGQSAAIALTLGLLPTLPRRAESVENSSLDPTHGVDQAAEAWSWVVVLTTVVLTVVEGAIAEDALVMVGVAVVVLAGYNLTAHWLFPNVGGARLRQWAHVIVTAAGILPLVAAHSETGEGFLFMLMAPAALAARAVGPAASWVIIALGVLTTAVSELLFHDGNAQHMIVRAVLFVVVGSAVSRSVWQQRQLMLRLRTAQEDLQAANEELLAQGEALVTGQEALAAQNVRLASQARALARLANFDPLTGLVNRRRFREIMEAEVQQESSAGAVMFIDLDQFKEINDRLGHQVGDLVLQRVAVVLQKQVAFPGVVARLGGDEFAVLIPGVSRSEAADLAERMLQGLRTEKVQVNGEELRTRASIGVTLYPEQGRSVDALLVNADLAMYSAKEGGRDAASLFGRERGPGADQEVEREIRSALAEGRMVLFFQPILDLRTGRVARHEALIRMLDRAGQVVPPADFLPAAERLPVIREIDRWVVCEAIRLVAVPSAGAPPLKLEVNLSGRAFEDPELLPLIAAALRRSKADPARLVFEVTETTAISDLERARQFAEAVREMGCSFAIDDFGAGFASFAYLKHLPVDCLKIDGSFIRDLPRSFQDQQLVSAMAGMAKALGIETIAEWVTDEDSIRLLQSMGVDFAQGYGVGMPADSCSSPGEPDRLSSNSGISPESSCRMLPSERRITSSDPTRSGKE